MTIDYASFPSLTGVYLEDSFVLGISESPNVLRFRLDAVLTPEHPAYHPPLSGERYCYASGTLIFDEFVRVEWLSRPDRYYTDASGEKDYGNIDGLLVDGGSVVAEGDWGRVRLHGARLRFETDDDA